MAIPVFKNTTARMTRSWSLWLNDNSISSIMEDAFVDLKNFSDNQRITISLSRNNLTNGSIDVNAFNGIESFVDALDLSGNKLTSMPAAVAKLKSLREFTLLDNPISTVDAHIFSSISHSLRTLYISLKHVQSWPVAFHYLVGLEYLMLNNYTEDIPLDAFKGFRSTLKHLYLSSVQFKYIPLAVCSLSHLEDLSIATDDNLSGDNLVYCAYPMISVTALAFTYAGLQVYPDLSQTFPNLRVMKIAVSNISYVDDSTIPVNASLTSFSVTDSKLTTVPGAVNEYPFLTLCRLDRNEIRTIERHSVENLLSLQTLTLDGNPIVFISKYAFFNLPSLSRLSLQRTKLTTLPQAIVMLPNLRSLELQNNDIMCNCDVSWIKDWASTTSVIVRGKCNLYTEVIADFLNTTLPHCP